MDCCNNVHYQKRQIPVKTGNLNKMRHIGVIVIIFFISIYFKSCKITQ